MNWAQLKDVDILALPWGQVLAWPRLWQWALLVLGWVLALLVFVYAWYWPQQDRLSEQAQQRAHRNIQQDNVQANIRARTNLVQQLHALQDQPLANAPTHTDWLHLLEQISGTGVAVQQWRRQGGGEQHAVLQGQWPAVYQALSTVSRGMLWGQLKLQRINGATLQASLDVHRYTPVPALPASSHSASGLTQLPSPFAELAVALPTNERLDAGVSAAPTQVQATKAPVLSRAGMHDRQEAQRKQALAQPLTSMQLLGVVQTGNTAVALVLAGGRTWRVKPGDRLGARGLRVLGMTVTAVQLGQGQTLVVAAEN